MENTYGSEGKLLCRVYPTLDRTDTYDNNGKILTKQQGDIIETYTYDSFGNVLSRKTVEAGRSHTNITALMNMTRMGE